MSRPDVILHALVVMSPGYRMAVRVAALLFAFALLAACGQKGPLYLPDEDSAEQTAEQPS